MKFIFDNNKPIYLQLVEQLKLYIISGKIKNGERLPSVRDLAITSQVNPNTMQRALNELEDMKLIYTERTNGKFVCNNTDIILKYKKEMVNEETTVYLKNMSNLGYEYNDVLEYLERRKK